MQCSTGKLTSDIGHTVHPYQSASHGWCVQCKRDQEMDVFVTTLHSHSSSLCSFAFLHLIVQGGLVSECAGPTPHGEHVLLQYPGCAECRSLNFKCLAVHSFHQVFASLAIIMPSLVPSQSRFGVSLCIGLLIVPTFLTKRQIAL